jgi:MerR family transcriptional regulator, light-induced transcriptional regulator
MMPEVVPDIDVLQERLRAALLAADRHGAEDVVNDAFVAGLDGIDVLDRLLAPAMYEVGRLWEAGEISIADEHLATAIVHGTLTRIYPRLATAAARSHGIVLLAGADGEEHVLGLRMIADVLEASGFDVRNVGGAVAAQQLAAAVVRHHPVLVGVANTLGGPRALLSAVEAVRGVAPELPILLGGASAAELEADGITLDAHTEVCRSARQALQAAQRLAE